MLSDRDYMGRNPFRESQQRAYNGGKLVIILIIINVFFYLFVPPPTSLYPNGAFLELALTSDVITTLKLWKLITYMFLHGGIWHIVFNMWGLYLFGMPVARELGAAKFFNLYMISGICGGLLWLVFNLGSPYPVVGASGAVFGIIIAAAMLYPNMQIILLIPPIPMKMKTFAIVFVLIEVFSQFTSIQGMGIAHLAHLGGFFGGYLYMKFAYDGPMWDMFSFFKLRRSGYNSARHWEIHNFSDDDEIPAEEIDRILDKISYYGINSLTEKELETLRRAREQMQKR